MRYIEFSIPIPAHSPFLWLSGFGLIILSITWLAAKWDKIENWLYWAKKTFWPANDAPASMLRKFAILASPIGILLFAVSVWRLYYLLISSPEAATVPTAGDDLRNHYLAFVGVGTFLIGLIGIPFAISRITAIERQTRTQEDSHITDQINAAVAGLGVDKTIKKQRTNESGKRVYEKCADGEVDFTKPIYEEISAPNIEVRIGALYALERIARLNLEEHIHVMEIICAYIRENAKATSLNPSDEIKERPAVREDIQTALTILGRRSLYQKEIEKTKNFYLNLKRTDLSGSDFYGADLSGALMVNCRIEAADFRKAILNGTKFFGSVLNYSDFFSAKLHGTRFDHSIINRPVIERGRMSESITMADISVITVSGADISEINYLGEFNEQRKIFGTKDTKLHNDLKFDIDQYRKIWTNRWRARREKNQELVIVCEAEMEKNKYFPEWFPFDSTDGAYGAALSLFLEKNNCIGWPHQ